jgi:hypothetical protein
LLGYVFSAQAGIDFRITTGFAEIDEAHDLFMSKYKMRKLIDLVSSPVEDYSNLPLLEGRQDYEAMFAKWLNDPEHSNFHGWIRDRIKWAREVLRKSDRVIWYLRYIKALVMDSTSPDGNMGELWLETFDPDATSAYSAYSYANFTGPRIQQKLEHIMGLESPKIQNFVFGKTPVNELFRQLDEIEREWIKDSAGKIADDHSANAAAEVIVDCGGGWYWINLNRPSCSEEARMMGHCGNSPRGGSGDKLLSLRKKIMRGSKTFWEPHLTFILDDEHYLTEMKGRGNEKPNARYHEMIVKLLLNPVVEHIIGGGYLPENNFAVTDLSPSLRRKLVAARPEFRTIFDCFDPNDPVSDRAASVHLRGYLRSTTHALVRRPDAWEVKNGMIIGEELLSRSIGDSLLTGGANVFKVLSKNMDHVKRRYSFMTSQEKDDNIDQIFKDKAGEILAFQLRAREEVKAIVAKYTQTRIAELDFAEVELLPEANRVRISIEPTAMLSMLSNNRDRNRALLGLFIGDMMDAHQGGFITRLARHCASKLDRIVPEAAEWLGENL